MEKDDKAKLRVLLDHCDIKQAAQQTNKANEFLLAALKRLKEK
ncbi:MAG: hypothetical protein NTZ04_06870 [Chloroflexi bacterium]|nr:hypothetical protein [Chloroflexota bacterium]